MGDTLDVKFTTVNTTGVPTTLAGTPAVSAYVGNGTTEITAGITLTVDFDGRTGLHNVRVVASSGNGFAVSTNVNLVITAGTVGGNSVIGYVVGSFAIQNRVVNTTAWAGTTVTTNDIAIKTTLAKTTHVTGFNDISTANVQTELGTYGALKPTVAARTLDVSTGGEAGVDWANVGAPTTTVALTNTTIGTATNLTNAPPNSAGITTLVSQLTGITSLKEWLGMIAGKQTGNTTARTEIRSSGAGSGTYDETTDSQEALRDNTGTAGVGLTNQPDPAGVTTLLTRIPSTLFTGITSLAHWLGSMAGKQTPNATAQTEMRATGAGSGTYDATADSNEAVRDRGDAAWTTGAGGDPWSTALPGAYASGTAGNIIGNRVDAATSTRATPAQVNTECDTALVDAGLTTTVTGRIDAAISTRSSQTSVDTLATYVDTEVAAIKVKTDQLVFTGGRVDANATITLTSTDFNNIADAVLKRDWTALSGEAAYSLLNAARMLRDKWNTTGGTLTVYKEDGSTTAWTRTLATDPTAAPITGAS